MTGVQTCALPIWRKRASRTLRRHSRRSRARSVKLRAMSQARITRVRLENYKSIKFCDVQLEPITVLVGENGAGKSNFLDAIEFTRDILFTNLDEALSKRGGFLQICRKSKLEKVESFSIILTLEVSQEKFDVFFEIAFSESLEKAVIQREKLTSMRNEILYETENGFLISNNINLLETSYSNRLAIASQSSSELKSRSFAFLLMIQSLNTSMDSFREIKNINQSDLILSNGSNLDSLLYKIYENDKLIFNKVNGYFTKINHEFTSIEVEKFNDYIFIKFLKEDGIALNISNISDGSLKALGILTALYYCSYAAKQKLLTNVGSLITLEEPESGIHPSYLYILLAAIRDVSPRVQVILTTHSPDLLEQIEIKSGHETVLIVESVNGKTIIDEIDSASLEAVNRKLFDLGELLRMRQLEPKSLVGRDR